MTQFAQNHAVSIVLYIYYFLFIVLIVRYYDFAFFSRHRCPYNQHHHLPSHILVDQNNGAVATDHSVYTEVSFL